MLILGSVVEDWQICPEQPPVAQSLLLVHTSSVDVPQKSELVSLEGICCVQAVRIMRQNMKMSLFISFSRKKELINISS